MPKPRHLMSRRDQYDEIRRKLKDQRARKLEMQGRGTLMPNIEKLVDQAISKLEEDESSLYKEGVKDGWLKAK